MEPLSALFEAAKQSLPPQPKLVGECNQCGLCCMDENGKCEHLEVNGRPGLPMSASCSLYGSRYEGMPVKWISRHGGPPLEGLCTKNSDMETAIIRLRGIGKGCSFTEEW
jgi:hypothetical protein